MPCNGTPEDFLNCNIGYLDFQNFIFQFYIQENIKLRGCVGNFHRKEPSSGIIMGVRWKTSLWDIFVDREILVTKPIIENLYGHYDSEKYISKLYLFIYLIIDFLNQSILYYLIAVLK